MKTLLVGTRHHPLADLLLSHLSEGQRVILWPRPQNPYDEHAVEVWLSLAEVPPEAQEELDPQLAEYGFSSFIDLLDNSCDGPEPGWRMLGHLASEEGKPLQIARERGEEGLVSNRDFAQVREGWLSWNPLGNIIITAEKSK